MELGWCIVVWVVCRLQCPCVYVCHPKIAHSWSASSGFAHAGSLDNIYIYIHYNTSVPELIEGKFFWTPICLEQIYYSFLCYKSSLGPIHWCKVYPENNGTPKLEWSKGRVITFMRVYHVMGHHILAPWYACFCSDPIRQPDKEQCQCHAIPRSLLSGLSL